HGKMEGNTIPIRQPEFLIGRDAQCHLRPASELISKRHCALRICDECVFVRDFDSTNGTQINGIPIKGEATICNGDLLKIGPLEFRVVVEAFAPRSNPTSLPPTARTDEDEAAASLLLLADDDVTGRAD